MLCTCERDGGGCGEDRSPDEKHLYLVVYTDETTDVFCGACINANPNQWEVGTKIYAIGDDVTHHFL